MSFIFGMNVSEYKYIPLHLFPYLQIEIVFNKYAIFKRSHREIFFRNKFSDEYIKNETNRLIGEQNSLVNSYVSLLFNMGLRNFHNNAINFLNLCIWLIELSNGNDINRGDFITLLNVINEDLIKSLDYNNPMVSISNLLTGFWEMLGYGDDDILKGTIGFAFALDSYTRKIKDLIHKINIIPNDQQYTDRSTISLYDGLLNNEILGREFSISTKIFLITEQLFFEVSDHYKMINSINTFSMITSGFDLQKNDFDENNKPNEYVTVNFPRSSIKKFISCFYSKEFTNRANIRQLARYSKDIVKYNVRIGVNTYPQNQLNGITSSSAQENQNNMLFLNELFKSFGQEDYGILNKGIINSKNYALNFQTSDIIENVNELVQPRRLFPLKNEIIGRSIICVRTNKIPKTIGIFTGENNSSGSDIVRYINVLKDEGIRVSGKFFEMIIIEYDMIFVVEGIGKFKIIR